MKLSTNEHQAMSLIVSGLMQKQICDRMKAADSTVHTYITRAKRKLGAKTVAQAAVLFVKAGAWIAPDAADIEYESWGRP